MVSQITSRTIFYSNVHWGADQRKHQNSASLAFVRGIHHCPVNSPHKWPVTQKMFPFDDVIMILLTVSNYSNSARDLARCHLTSGVNNWDFETMILSIVRENNKALGWCLIQIALWAAVLSGDFDHAEVPAAKKVYLACIEDSCLI